MGLATRRFRRGLVHILILAGGLSLPLAASAQSADETRLRKIESEVRALQRKVFPDGAGKTFEPQITATPAAAEAPPSATTPVADMLARMDAVEAQLQRLTAQTEENANRLSRIEARLGSPDAAPVSVAPAGSTAAPSAAAATGGSSLTGSVEGNASAMGATSAPAQAPAQTPAQAPATPAKAAAPSAARVAAVSAIAKPSTADKADDEYSYGYRLWEAKFYPEAEQQLTRYVEGYPKHSKISYGRNLLGRAYLDDGKPGTAAQWFYKNYQADPQGARAPDSLLYLGVAMVALKENQRACVAIKQFDSDFPKEAAGRLAKDRAALGKQVTCN